MTFLGFKTKWNCEQAIYQLLADTPFDQPFQIPLLERLFLEEDWCRKSIEALRSTGKPTWFMTVDHLDGHGVGQAWPHLLIWYSLSAYREQGSPRYEIAPSNSVLAPGWVLRSWEDCMRKTVKRFEKKVKADMRTWCQAQLDSHRTGFPACEDCGQPASLIQHVRPRFDEIADAMLRRARSQYNDANIPLPWFTESRHFGPDYPQRLQEDFLAESCRARLRSLCNSCGGKPTYWRQPYHVELAQLRADDEEFTRLLKERAKRKHDLASRRIM